MKTKEKPATGVEPKLRDLIALHLGVDDDKIILGARFVEDLGADSLDTVEMVMTFEEEYDLQITDDDADKIVTVQDAQNYVMAHSKKKAT
jgi:acyl carrier protein